MFQGIVGQKLYNIVEKSKNNLPHELLLTARQKKLIQEMHLKTIEIIENNWKYVNWYKAV